ncbi:MAG: DUF362 domain-containing protein [Blautia sp.]|nr:DUF362 domain-containing protein [Blautia sp.]
MEKSKVIVIPCSEYKEERIYREMKASLDLLGGIRSFVKPEEKILLKPNLLKRAEVDKAVITHPDVIGAFARILREENYPNLIFADSSGMGTTTKVIKGTGIDTYLEKYHIPAIDYSEAVKVDYPQGNTAKSFMLPKELTEVDCVISLCKMKTHALERITGAVKNSYGFVYGTYKALGHTIYSNADSFARMLVDLNQYVDTRLFVMDGIMAMEGNGPGSGDPTPMNVILMSTDPVALDTVFSHLIYLDPKLVPTNLHGEQLGLGNMHRANIQILLPDGKEITVEELQKRFGNPKFNVDRKPVRHNAWSRVNRMIKVFQKKPYIDASKCIKCGICVKACPVEGKAVRFKQGKGKPPVYNYKKCIRCFCCQEMCPQKAIKVK